jgi:RNA polymerase sigma factor (TIGR02999 family)
MFDGTLIPETSFETLRSEDSLAKRDDAFGAEKPTYLEICVGADICLPQAEIAEAQDGIIGVMTDVTQILSHIESGDTSAAEQLLPLVYDELRKLAAARLANEKPGQTLQATALVHEAYLRLVDVDTATHWDSRGHFFVAAAEAMRRILVDSARRRASLKRGGDCNRIDLSDQPASTGANQIDLLALDEALRRLEMEQPDMAQLVKLRYFAGRTLEETAQMLGISRATAQRNWAYARAWLFGQLSER